MADEAQKIGQTVGQYGLKEGVKKIAMGEADLSRQVAAEAEIAAGGAMGKAAQNVARMNKINAGLSLAQAAGAGTKEAFGLEFDPVGLLVSGAVNTWKAGGRQFFPETAKAGEYGFGGEDWRYPIGWDSSNINQRGAELEKAQNAGLAKAYKTVTGGDYEGTTAQKVGNVVTKVGGYLQGVQGAMTNALTAGGYDAVTGPMLEKAGVDINAAGIEKDPYSTGKVLDWAFNDSEKPVDVMPEWDPSKLGNYTTIEPTAQQTRPDSGVAMREQMDKIEANGVKRFYHKEGENYAGNAASQYVAETQPWRPDYQLPADHPIVKGLSEDDRKWLRSPNATRESISSGLTQATEAYQYALQNGNPKEIETTLKTLNEFKRAKAFHDSADAYLKSDYEKRRNEQISRKQTKRK